MKSNKKKGRLIGLLFLLFVIIGGIGANMRGLSTSLIKSQTFLKDVFENSMQMKFAILLDIVGGLIAIYITIILFSIIKRYSKNIALWFFSLCIIQNAVFVFSNITHLSLISLSKEFVNKGTSNIDYFNLLGILIVEEYYLAHWLGLIIFSLWTSILYYFLYKTNLVPRFLSVWGIIAATLVFGGTWLQIFDYNVNGLIYAHNGLFLIFLPLWLLVRGFRQPTKEGVRPSV